MEEKNICKTCGNKLIRKATKRKPSQLQQPYYYTAYYWCPNCRKLFHDEKFKVVNDLRANFRNSQTPSDSPLSGGEMIDSLPDKGGLGRVFRKAEVEIWTDGACVFNGQENARAAWAFVSGETEQAGLVPGPKQTNNVAEALAIYHALLWAAEQGFKHIKIHTDSQISLYNLRKDPIYINHNQEIFQMIADVIVVNGLHASYIKVLGHSGDPNNERADRLANQLAGVGL